MKSLPRYLLIVLALAGDSTMRRFFAMAGVGSGKWGGSAKARAGRGVSPGLSFLLGGPGDRACQAGVPKSVSNGVEKPARKRLVDGLRVVPEHLRFHPGE